LCWIAEPFVQAIVDVEVPRMAIGRVCLIATRPSPSGRTPLRGTAKAAATPGRWPRR
jgi:hypothetical protein